MLSIQTDEAKPQFDMPLEERRRMASACTPGGLRSGKNALYRLQQYPPDQGRNYNFSNIVMGGNNNFVVKRMLGLRIARAKSILIGVPQSTEACTTKSGRHQRSMITKTTGGPRLQSTLSNGHASSDAPRSPTVLLSHLNISLNHGDEPGPRAKKASIADLATTKGEDASKQETRRTPSKGNEVDKKQPQSFVLRNIERVKELSMPQSDFQYLGDRGLHSAEKGEEILRAIFESEMTVPKHTKYDAERCPGLDLGNDLQQKRQRVQEMRKIKLRKNLQKEDRRLQESEMEGFARSNETAIKKEQKRGKSIRLESAY